MQNIHHVINAQKFITYICFEFSRKAQITWSMYDLETNTKQLNQRLVPQPTRLDGYTNFNILAKVHLYQKTHSVVPIN